MKVRLMFADKDFDPELPNPHKDDDLSRDLGLETLLLAMANRDQFVLDTCRAALMQTVTDEATIRLRQQVLADCLAHPEFFASLYSVAVEGIDADRHIHLGPFEQRPGPKLRRSRDCLVQFLTVLRRIRLLVEQHAGELSSPSMHELCETVLLELSTDYLDEVDACLRTLAFKGGSLSSARLGTTNESTGHVLRKPPSPPQLWRLLDPAGRHPFDMVRSRHTITVDPRDTGGLETLGSLEDLGMAPAAEALAASVDHVLGFFRTLRRELAFYLGCAHLHTTLTAAGQATCMPEPVRSSELALSATGLVDPLLAVAGRPGIVGNDIKADGAGLVVITGANQGGKSTFLRALGIAQHMMQCGMYVVADNFRATVATGIHTHFKREEDDTMASGKFDEELDRMSHIVDRLQPGSLVLLNESFASTNEREAATIGGDVIEAMLGADIRVYVVTHLYELGARLHTDVASATFLRAERLRDGTRTFRLEPGDPLRTSYGDDLFNEIFGEVPTSELLQERSRVSSDHLRPEVADQGSEERGGRSPCPTDAAAEGR